MPNERGKRFFRSYNNGVVAIISASHAELYGRIKGSMVKPREGVVQALRAGARVFTFCAAERLQRHPEERFIFTGTHELLEQLEVSGRYIFVDHGHGGWDGYVPFSNGYECGFNGEQVAQEELEFRTTVQDFIDAFGGVVLAAAA